MRARGHQTLPEAMTFTVERIKDLRDRRRVVYWRWSCDGKVFAAVSKRDQGWRALIYWSEAGGNPPRTELGYHSNRRQAEQAVQDWARQNPHKL